ncbi:MAG: hypothetical protein LBH32_02225 [Dysgonamonadaceae bacterium]|jgi:hypothetical protein|nr:hypothetical protein [Dysgonamonadaceae bacterium]
MHLKKITEITAGICALLIVFSCEETVKEPRLEASINKELLTVNESMIIDFSGSVADNIVVYPGDDMQNYDLRDKSNTGLVVNKKLFTYSYRTPGVYKVVCLASTSGDMASDLKFATSSFTVTVIDDQTEIDRISCPQIIRDEVFAEKHANDEWLMVLPRSVMYNNGERNISLSQRLRFFIQSDSTKISVNGNSYSSTTAYNLASPVDILVISDYGTERPYKLYTINYPRFSSFKLLGVDGTATLNEFNYSTSVMNVTLPSGTDVSSLVPEFATYSPSDKVYIGNTEQVSGASPVDFTKEITYRLVSALPDKPEMKAESTVVVRIKFQ